MCLPNSTIKEDNKTNDFKMEENFQIPKMPSIFHNQSRHFCARPHQRPAEHCGPVVGGRGVPLQLQRDRGLGRDRDQGQVRQVQANHLQEPGQGRGQNILL